MTAAILDTNVLVQALLSSPTTAAARTLDACQDRRYHLIYSPEILNEWLETLLVPHIRARHGLSDDEILEVLASLLMNATPYLGEVHVPASLTRDPTDTKFLALAHESGADYFVTKDNRHLLRLKQYERTRILTPSKFLRELDRLTPPA